MLLSPTKRVKGLNEDVFVTQLIVRAEAVDLEFQVTCFYVSVSVRERTTVFGRYPRLFLHLCLCLLNLSSTNLLFSSRARASNLSVSLWRAGTHTRAHTHTYARMCSKRTQQEKIEDILSAHATDVDRVHPDRFFIFFRDPKSVD